MLHLLKKYQAQSKLGIMLRIVCSAFAYQNKLMKVYSRLHGDLLPFKCVVSPCQTVVMCAKRLRLTASNFTRELGKRRILTNP